MIKMNFRKDLEALLSNLHARKKTLEAKTPSPSIEGMLIKIEQQIPRLENYLIDDRELHAIIPMLYERGYHFSTYSDPERPEFTHRFPHKDVRVRVEPTQIMILLDPGAGTRLTRGNEFVNPNAWQFKYDRYNEIPHDALATAEERGASAEADDHYLARWRELGYVESGRDSRIPRLEREISAILTSAVRDGYAATEKRFQISSKTIRKYLSKIAQYYQPHAYGEMDDEELEKWFQLYYTRFVRANQRTPTEEKWLIELLALRDISFLRKTYHYHAIDKLLQNK